MAMQKISLDQLLAMQGQLIDKGRLAKVLIAMRDDWQEQFPGEEFPVNFYSREDGEIVIEPLSAIRKLVV